MHKFRNVSYLTDFCRTPYHLISFKLKLFYPFTNIDLSFESATGKYPVKFRGHAKEDGRESAGSTKGTSA